MLIFHLFSTFFSNYYIIQLCGFNDVYVDFWVLFFEGMAPSLKP